jgi:hypothetical protein
MPKLKPYYEAENRVNDIVPLEHIDAMARLITKIRRNKNISERSKSIYLWHITTALRGPDSDKVVHTPLKYYTTARIRAIVGIKADHIGFIVNKIPLSKVEMSERDRLLLETCDKHFASHYRWARWAIADIYQYNLLNETNLKEELRKNGSKTKTPK